MFYVMFTRFHFSHILLHMDHKLQTKINHSTTHSTPLSETHPYAIDATNSETESYKSPNTKHRCCCTLPLSHQSVCQPPVCLSVSQSVSQPVSQPPVCLSVSQSVCLSVCQSVCQPVSLSVSLRLLLVPIHLLVLQRQAVQHLLQLRLLVVRHGLGGHLHVQGPPLRRDECVDLLDG
jgi:hypothetical protein